VLNSHHPGDDLLLLALDGEFSSRGLARVATHVAGCATCQERAAQLRATVGRAERLYRASDAPDVTHARQRSRLEQALQEAAEAPASRWGAWLDLPALQTGLAVAASLAAVVLALQVVNGSGAIRVAQRAGRVTAGNPLPVATLTPGAVSNLTAAELCAGSRTSRTVSQEVRQRVLTRYGMEGTPSDRYELDALVTLDLGGTVEPENLWPQAYESPLWNARIKDALERLLADEVCRGRIPLWQAQREIATDWVASYKRRFHTDAPLPSHAQSTEVDDDLEFEAPATARTIARYEITPAEVRQ
jgi:hypothetical protein